MADFADSPTTELERKLGPLRVVAITETCSYAFLLFFWLSGNRAGTLLVGSLHGMVVCAFAGMILLIYKPIGWSLTFAIAAIISGPIGALAIVERLRREGPAIRAREHAKAVAP